MGDSESEDRVDIKKEKLDSESDGVLPAPSKITLALSVLRWK